MRMSSSPILRIHTPRIDRSKVDRVWYVLMSLVGVLQHHRMKYDISKAVAQEAPNNIVSSSEDNADLKLAMTNRMRNENDHSHLLHFILQLLSASTNDLEGGMCCYLQQ